MGKTNSDPRATPWWTDLVLGPGLQRPIWGCRRSLEHCRNRLRPLPAFQYRGRSFRSRVFHPSGPTGRRDVPPRREKPPVFQEEVSRTASPAAAAIRGSWEPWSASLCRPVSVALRGAGRARADPRCRREPSCREPTRSRGAGSRREVAVHGLRRRRERRPTDAVARPPCPFVRRAMTFSRS